jgi:hypothetical protein
MNGTGIEQKKRMTEAGGGVEPHKVQGGEVKRIQ